MQLCTPGALQAAVPGQACCPYNSIAQSQHTAHRIALHDTSKCGYAAAAAGPQLAAALHRHQYRMQGRACTCSQGLTHWGITAAASLRLKCPATYQATVAVLCASGWLVSSAHLVLCYNGLLYCGEAIGQPRQLQQQPRAVVCAVSNVPASMCVGSVVPSLLHTDHLPITINDTHRRWPSIASPAMAACMMFHCLCLHACCSSMQHAD
jgi:hypothetical protein